MLPLDYAVQRIQGVLAEIESLKDEDFPYRDSRLALEQIEALFKKRLDSLLELTDDSDPNVVKTACSESLLQNFKFLPKLGFIVRSTNVRNSFEVFWPLLRLARTILGPSARLILSSEWQFSPFVHRQIADLPGYVLLGLPASESGNPLLVPLAGHELGHTTWQLNSLDDEFGPVIWNLLRQAAKEKPKAYREVFGREFSDDLFAEQNLGLAYQWALRQAEETFCDFFGLRLFGASYLHAFAYLLAPGGTRRDTHYPCLEIRIQNMLEVAASMSIEPHPAFSDGFMKDLPAKCSERDQFLLELADEAALSVRNDLLVKAVSIADDAKAPRHSPEMIQQTTRAFKLLTPASHVGNLTDILAAAWELHYDENLWAGMVSSQDRRATLHELVLKSIEILEYEEREIRPDDAES